MRKNRLYILSAVLFSVLFITCKTFGMSTITIGRATDNVDIEYKRLNPIIEYLAAALKGNGIDTGEVVLDGLNDDEAIIQLINEKKLDIILESPFSAAHYNYRTGAYPILLVSREGVIEYNSYIFTRKDSNINSLEDLHNKTIAFEDPTSTSSYHLPKMAIEHSGHKLTIIGPNGKKLLNQNIGYLFAGSELNVSSWVFFKKVDAGALSSQDWINPEECPDAFRNQFKIIYKTKKIPRMMVLIRKEFPEELVLRIKELMLKMHESESGKQALEFYKLDRFVDAPDAALQLLADIKKRLFPTQ